MRIFLVLFMLLPIVIHRAEAQDGAFLPELEVITAENAHHIEELSILGGGYPGQVAWSPDGRILAVGSVVGVWLYNTDDWNEPPRLLVSFRERMHFTDGSFGPGVAFSPDGNVLAFNTSEGVRLWDMESDTEIIAPDLNHTGRIENIAFSPDGEYLLTSGSLRLIFWDTENWERDRFWASPRTDDYITFHNITFSPDGSMFATSGNYRGNVILWNPDETEMENAMIANVGATPFDYIVTSIAFSVDGEIMAIRSEFFSTETFEEVEFADSPGLSVAFSPDGRYFAASNTGVAHPVGYFGPTSVNIYDAMTGTELVTWPNHEQVRYLSFSPDSHTLIAVSAVDGRVRVWDVASQTEIAVLQYALDPFSLEWSPDASQVLIGAAVFDGYALFDIQQGRTVDTYQREERGLDVAATFSPTGDFIGARETETGVILSNITRDEEVTLPAHGRLIRLSFSADGQFLATNGDDLWIWETSSGTQVSQMETDEVSFNQAAQFNLNGSMVALIDGQHGNSYLRIWDIETGEVIRDLTAHPYDFDARAPFLVSTDQFNVILWNVESGERIFTSSPAPVSVPINISSFAYTATFTPDGQQLAYAGASGYIRIWSVDDGEILTTLQGRDSSISRLVLSDDSTLMLTGDFDGVLQIWDYQAQEMIATINAHSGTQFGSGISDILVHPDQTLIVTSGRDGTVRFWGIPTESE